MSKYVFQLRRGTRCVDDDGMTLLNPDGTEVRNDWGAYTLQEGHINPLEGELVLEYELYPDGKKIPRLKIGDGISEFSDLEYMSVDSFILPKQASVTLYGSEDTSNINQPQWTEEVDSEGNFLGRYKQEVTVENAVITANSKIDLNPTSEMLAVFHEKDVAFVAENDNGNVVVYCIGQKPQNTYKDIPVTVTEVIDNG